MKKRIYQISICVFIFDQFLKYLITRNFVYQKTVAIIPHFFYLQYIKNTGGAFSIFSNSIWFFVLIGMVFLIGMVSYIAKKKEISFLEQFSFGLLIGGVLGNLIDRILFHGVIDYLGIIIFSYYFPIFNFADICIVCGTLLMGIVLVGENHENRSSRK